MFDIYLGEIELTMLIVVFSVAVLLPVQLLLCFKVKSRFARLAPAVVLLALAAVFVMLWLSTPGWDGLGYAILAAFGGFMAFVCGLGWGIWALVCRMRK